MITLKSVTENSATFTIDYSLYLGLGTTYLDINSNGNPVYSGSSVGHPAPFDITIPNLPDNSSILFEYHVKTVHSSGYTFESDGVLDTKTLLPASLSEAETVGEDLGEQEGPDEIPLPEGLQADGPMAASSYSTWTFRKSQEFYSGSNPPYVRSGAIVYSDTGKLKIRVRGISGWTKMGSGTQLRVTLYESDGVMESHIKTWNLQAKTYDQDLIVYPGTIMNDGSNNKAEYYIVVSFNYRPSPDGKQLFNFFD